jgi:signal transduction histidine kinase
MKKPVLDGRTAAAGVAGAAALLLARALARERGRCRRALKERDAARARADEEIVSFAGLAAHDLRSPLRKAAAFASQLQERLGAELDETSRDFFARLQRSVDGMQALVDGLASLSRASASVEPRRELDLSALAEEAVAGLRSTVEATGARVRVYALPRVVGETAGLRRVLSALLSNALKFRSPGRAPDVSVRGRVDGAFVELRVEDQGVGFDPARAGKLFRPFSRLHSAAEFPGAGLGLAECRRIVERHGGAIRAESGPGGTVVTVRLPAAREGAWTPA